MSRKASGTEERGKGGKSRRLTGIGGQIAGTLRRPKEALGWRGIVYGRGAKMLHRLHGEAGQGFFLSFFHE